MTYSIIALIFKKPKLYAILKYGDNQQNIKQKEIKVVILGSEDLKK